MFTAIRLSINILRKLRKVYILCILIAVGCCVYYLIISQQTHNSPFALPFINKSDLRLCYKNFVFNEHNQDSLFMDLSDDVNLRNTNAQNIFFHLTNCIYDGIPTINLRFV